MPIWIRKVFAAPVFEDEDKTRAASLLNTILLSVLAIAVMAGIITPFISTTPLRGLMAIATTILLALGTLFLMRRGRVRLASGLFSSAVWGLDTLLIIGSGGIRSPIPPGYIVITVMAGLLLGGHAAIAFAGLSIVAGLGMLHAESLGLLPSPIIPFTSASGWTSLTSNLILAAALLHLATRRINDALERARRYAAELEEQRGRLEETIEGRTRDLARRARYLEATAEVARGATAVLDLQVLLSRVVSLISERFGFYHTGIFLLDPTGEWAVLQAASSEGGQRMLARGHRLKVGKVGIVGYVTRKGKPRIALDVGKDAVYFDNPDLPGTRSEMALPLRARGEIIGALDVQSKEPAAFSDEDVAVLQTLADQVAMAISNARLFQQAQESLEVERRAYGELSRQAWRELIHIRPDLGFVSDERGISPAGDLWEPRMEAALKTGEITPGDGDGADLAIPIKVRGQVIGVIDARKPEDAGEWTAEEVALIQTLTEQLGVALESARLYQDARRRAVREQLTREITDKMRRVTDVEGIVQAAVDELFSALGTSRAFVRLGAAPSAQDDGGDEHKQ
jgi:GAF domain-containing protein